MKTLLTIVSPTWLHNQIDKNIIILDTTKMSDNVAHKQVIPGAIHFDLQVFKDGTSEYPNTLLTTEAFQQKARLLGINNDSRIVVYDDKGVYTSPRVWWMFKYFGIDNITLLDGGLPAYIQRDYPTQIGHSKPSVEGKIVAYPRHGLLKSYDQVKRNCESQDFCHIDVRSSGRFQGVEPEPRKGLKSGSIPKSHNLPYHDVLKNGQYKSKADLVDLFETKQVSLEKPVIYSCGSGTTACIVLLAYAIAFGEIAAVFDGSWTEWAMKKELYTDK